MENELQKIRKVADYQFGRNVGTKLFPDGVQISHSRKTGRIRYVYLDNERLVTMRPTDGLFTLSITGAKRILDKAKTAKCVVTVRNGVVKFITEGSDVFATHVINVDSAIRPRDEVVVVDEQRELLAVGYAVLSADEMKSFKRGVAVKTRRGCLEES